DSGLTTAQNGLALAGDRASAAPFLGFTGLTALYGMDGGFCALGPLCPVLFLIAEPMRNAREVHPRRCRVRPDADPNIAFRGHCGTVVVNFAYLMPQNGRSGSAGMLVDGDFLLSGRRLCWRQHDRLCRVRRNAGHEWVQIVKEVLMLIAG